MNMCRSTLVWPSGGGRGKVPKEHIIPCTLHIIHVEHYTLHISCMTHYTGYTHRTLLHSPGFCMIACIIYFTVHIVQIEHWCYKCSAHCALCSLHCVVCTALGQVLHFPNFPNQQLATLGKPEDCLAHITQEQKSKSEKASAKCEEKNWSVFMVWYFMVLWERKKIEEPFPLLISAARLILCCGIDASI